MKNRHASRKQGWKWALVSFLIIFLVAFGYAVLRYNVMKGVPADQIPLYVSNKAFALASVVLIGISFIMGPLARFNQRKFAHGLYLRKYFGVLGFGVAAMHGVISLLLFSPSYYPRFFTEAGKLTFSGELSMLFGVLSIFIFSAVAVTSLPSVEKGVHPRQWLFVQRLGYIAFALVLLHVTAMGWKGWLDASGWPAGMLPISLIAALAIILVLAARLLVMAFPRKR
ncbi:MAG: ferric reductase-like transmembrane domain-containing protein [Candidatus Aenigmarchaeota archaeon]|nr:ferric reductase-like transmembrane domain-containing protein [Candidatus Aenigmarchaeota archaeon]